MRRYISLYLYMFKLNMKKQLEYKADTVIGFISMIPLQIVEFLFIWVIFQNISQLNGWTFYEMTMIYGIMICSKGLADAIFDNFYDLGRVFLRQGTFDNLMVQPMNPLFNLISRGFYLVGLASFVVGIPLIITSIINLGLTFGLGQILLLIMFIICGGLIFGGLMTIAATSSFWVVESLDIIWTAYSMYQFALYPINLYNFFIRTFITFIFPYAFASYFPATLLLGKEGGEVAYLAPLVVAILWTIAIKIWNIGIKNYGSTGS